MKKLKKTIIILIILLVIVLICILIIKFNGNKKIKGEGDVSQDYIKSMGRVDDYQTFFTVEKMLDNFIKNLASQNKEVTYKLLDKEYLEENNITKNNILEKLANITQYNEVKIRKIYRQENEKNGVYYIECILEKEHSGKKYYFEIYTDVANSTYSIKNIDEAIYENEICNKEKNIAEKVIEKNEYNNITFVFSTEKERVNRYFKDFIENALYYPEYAYSMLDNQYKNKRFPTLESFKEYLNDRNEILLSYTRENERKATDFNDINEYYIYLSRQTDSLELEGYQIRYEEEYNRYICLDNYGNYYIFFATEPFNYSIILDSYTIELPELTRKICKRNYTRKSGIKY